MSETHHEGTEALKHLADEIEAERSSGEHTPFDAQDESDKLETDEDRDVLEQDEVDSDDPHRPDGGDSGSVPPLAVGH
ncbi:hypothetical protein [Demequina flava]|uniref:hypothetical protein n=1 Tax=Demequina flava TaxID=1095025 RepID=UPI000783414E|nr:hypothetical protein [Demequina flava]